LFAKNKLRVWNQAVTIHLLFSILVLGLAYASEPRAGNSSISYAFEAGDSDAEETKIHWTWNFQLMVTDFIRCFGQRDYLETVSND